MADGVVYLPGHQLWFSNTETGAVDQSRTNFEDCFAPHIAYAIRGNVHNGGSQQGYGVFVMNYYPVGNCLVMQILRASEHALVSGAADQPHVHLQNWPQQKMTERASA